jgi:hypothetical protein
MPPYRLSLASGQETQNTHTHTHIRIEDSKTGFTKTETHTFHQFDALGDLLRLRPRTHAHARVYALRRAWGWVPVVPVL